LTWLFKGIEFGLDSECTHIVKNSLFEFLVSINCIINCLSVGFGPVLDSCWLWNNEGDDIILQRISVNPNLSDER
jgi:hypothetical protein